MLYEWDSSLESGYPKVDNQHKQLISALNNLVEASRAGKGDEAVLQTMDFLVGYTVKHFADEENLQKKYEYPDYLGHKRIHDDFKESVLKTVQRVKQEGPSEALVAEVCASLGAWIVNHIRGDDFRMATYVKAMDKSLPAV